MTPKSKSSRQGFARTELLAIIIVVGTLALTQWAGLAKQGMLSQAALCQNNLAQLTRAWQLYSEDNDGNLPNNPISLGSPGMQSSFWAGGGWLDYSDNIANVDPELTIKKGALWPYTEGDARIWRCPADKSTAPTRASVSNYRMRSYSMNNWINGFVWYGDGLIPSPWRLFTNISDFTALGPNDALLLIDEHPGSINDNVFLIDMTGYPDSPRSSRMVDFPANGHAAGAGVSFVDGHTELKRWQNNHTLTPFVNRKLIPLNVSSPHNPDVFWLQKRATRKIGN